MWFMAMLKQAWKQAEIFKRKSINARRVILTLCRSEWERMTRFMVFLNGLLTNQFLCIALPKFQFLHVQLACLTKQHHLLEL